MSKMIRFTLIGLGILVLAGGLVFAGAMIGRWTGFGFGWLQPGYRMMVNRQLPGNIVSGYGHGMMRGENGTGPGMMGGGPGYGNVPGMGMMRGYGTTSDNVTPLTIDQAYQAAGKTLAALNNPDLKIAEVMVFDNNAYVRVVEKSTGIGAFELLVEPVSQVVYPEPGPNMMWNLKYGGMIGQQMMGGGKGNFPGMGMMGNYRRQCNTRRRLGKNANHFRPGAADCPKVPGHGFARYKDGHGCRSLLWLLHDRFPEGWQDGWDAQRQRFQRTGFPAHLAWNLLGSQGLLKISPRGTGR